MHIISFKGGVLMRQCTLIVVLKPHQGDTVIDNLVSYTINSPFAEPDEMQTTYLRENCNINDMIDDFYQSQREYDMTNHRVMFHFILTTRVSKDMCFILNEAAAALREYFYDLGIQSAIVPHYGSKTNSLRLHYHAIVNPISTTTHIRMIDKFGTHQAIVDYLNKHTHSQWCWKYHTYKKASNLY